MLRLKRLRVHDAAGGGGDGEGGGDAKGVGGGSCTNATGAGDVAGADDAPGDEPRSEFGRESGSEFGRGLYFSLENTVTQDSDGQSDAHEFLTARGTLVRLAVAHGLHPILVESMLRPSGGRGGGGGGGGGGCIGLPNLSAAEARVARLYFSFAFRKEGGVGESRGGPGGHGAAWAGAGRAGMHKQGRGLE